MFVLILVPSLYPFIFATLRIMFGVAWKVTLTAELFGGNSGLGYMINMSRQEFDTTTIFAAIILIIAFVHGVDELVLGAAASERVASLCALRNHLRPSTWPERLIGEGVVVLALIVWWFTARGLPEFILPGPAPVARRLARILCERRISSGMPSRRHGGCWCRSPSPSSSAAGSRSWRMACRCSKAWSMQRIKPVLNSFPSIGWAILAAIWFNPGDFGVIFVEVAILIPFCLINIAEGLRNIDRELMEMGTSFTPRSRAHPLAAHLAAAGALWAFRDAHRLRGSLEDRAGGGVARRAERTRLSDAARADRGRQHDLPCRLLCHRADLRRRRAAGDGAAGAALRATMRRSSNNDDDRDGRIWWSHTKTGELRGAHENGVAVFRGVPYAAAPSANCALSRRSQCPPGRVYAMRLRDGPVAPQGRSRLAHVMGDFERPQSEDCLTLNIWTPAADRKKRPVLVWIHGGAFSSGAGSLPWYSGERFAANGDVVVVSINYRLGALGFLCLPGVSAGNLGLLDQVAALRFVRDNIAAFGGDPDNVTVVGQSAGAASIAILMTMPLARGLFRRAILQSTPFGRMTRDAR